MGVPVKMRAVITVRIIDAGYPFKNTRKLGKVFIFHAITSLKTGETEMYPAIQDLKKNQAGTPAP